MLHMIKPVATIKKAKIGTVINFTYLNMLYLSLAYIIPHVSGNYMNASFLDRALGPF